MTPRLRSLLPMICLAGLISPPLCPGKTIFTHRFIEVGFDLLNRQSRWDKAVTQIDRASKVGYNGIFVSDNFTNVHLPPKANGHDKYRQMLAYVRSKGLYPVPASLNQTTPSQVDSTLCEAAPVRGTPFVVKGAEATVVSDHAIALKNGDFSAATNNKPDHWAIAGTAIPGKHVFVENGVLRVTNPEGRVGLKQRLDGLKPWRAYEFSILIQTKEYKLANRVNVEVWGNKRYSLWRRGSPFGRWGIPANSGGFAQYTVDFNSFDNTSATFVLVPARSTSGGYQGGSAGTILFDNAVIKEVGLYETIRRESCPVKVTSDDGTITYQEGKDYTVEPSNFLLDSKRRHPLGQKLHIPSGSRIQEGQILRVDWYQHANFEATFAPASFCSPKAWQIMDTIAQTVDQIFATPSGPESKGSQAWLCGYDEWRTAYWDPACISQYPSPGYYIGAVMAKTRELLKKRNWNREVYVWNDMYDPYHNAHKGGANYFMVNGNFWGSWEPVASDVVMVQWWYHANGIRWCAGLDPMFPKVFYPQILGVNEVPRALAWDRLLDTLERDHGDSLGILGMSYITSHYGDTDIENVARFYQRSGRWGSNPVPPYKAPGIRSAKGINNLECLAVECRTDGLIRYRLGANGPMRLRLFDARGRLVRDLEKAKKAAGEYDIRLKPYGLAAGVYLIKLEAFENRAKQERATAVARTRAILF